MKLENEKYVRTFIKLLGLGNLFFNIFADPAQGGSQQVDFCPRVSAYSNRQCMGTGTWTTYSGETIASDSKYYRRYLCFG